MVPLPLAPSPARLGEGVFLPLFQDFMKTAVDYRKHAQDCQELARQMPKGEQREQLFEMARTWDSLADEREDQERRAASARLSPPGAQDSGPPKR